MSASSHSSRYSSLDSIKLLLENKADINLQDNDGWTALTVSLKYLNTNSSLETVKLLLKNGANVNIKNNKGRTPLMVASKYSKEYSSEIVKLLIKYGAEVDDYNIISKHIIDNGEIFNLCINRIDFDNIEELKLIYSQINKNKLFSSMFIMSVSKLPYTELQKMYIIDTAMDKEKYDFIIKLNNKSMIKRVN